MIETRPTARQHVVRGRGARTYYGALIAGDGSLEVRRCPHVHVQASDAQRCAQRMQDERDRRSGA